MPLHRLSPAMNPRIDPTRWVELMVHLEMEHYLVEEVFG
jgi:hypothetical protein